MLTAGQGHDRIDFEEGVWVHRIVVKDQPPPSREALRDIPAHIWNYSRTMLDEALEIAARRKVDVVEAPIWDTEGAAFLGRPEFPLVTSLHTTLKFHLDTNPEKKGDAAFMANFARPMMRIERLLMESSDGIHANSDAIVKEIEGAYGFEFDRRSLWTIPHGLEDWTADAPGLPRSGQEGEVRICFIGRLESRKGVDVVMQVAPTLLREHPGVRLEFVGNDQIASDDGRPWREGFEATPEFDSIRGQVTFHGEVSEERLRQAYRDADIILAPSRFESFGLVHLEAAMYGKPVIGCRAGGMVEVVQDGVTGLLALPGDAPSLLDALRKLVAARELRQDMGRAARRRYLERFTPEHMAASVARMFEQVAARRAATGGSAAARAQ